MKKRAEQLLNYVILPTLRYLELDGENLLLGTAAVESHLGEYLRQDNGPACGIYQIEEATHKYIFRDWLPIKKPELYKKVKNLGSYGAAMYQPVDGFKSDLTTNLAYATAICRLKYLTIPEALPEPNDVLGMAKYWKKYYNTPLGKGTEAHFLECYDKYVLGN
jgi:hypothetical protein